MILAYRVAGLVALALGIVGIFLPVMPTVVFLLVAAGCFAKSNPEWERRIVEHPRFGPPIVRWRANGAIGPGAKAAALLALAGSAAMGLLLVREDPWRWVPLGVLLLVGPYILTRPNQ